MLDRSVVVVINPISGTGGRPDAARRRVEHARTLLERRGLRGDLFVTERVGHARELASAAVARGVPLVVAWGGDGTVNEVASALVHSQTTLAIVPSGSGNGLARELGIPLNAARALDTAIDGSDRRMDVGELDGRLFFNVAGIGFDARVAHQFAATGMVRRGMVRYAEVTFRELLTFEGEEHTITANGVETRTRTLLIAIANSRQYGSGAIIAPQARIDDGLLDIVVVAYRRPVATLIQIPRLFSGRVADVSGVTLIATSAVEIGGSRSISYHVDGEPHVGGLSLKACIHTKVLTVRAA